MLVGYDKGHADTDSDGDVMQHESDCYPSASKNDLCRYLVPHYAPHPGCSISSCLVPRSQSERAHSPTNTCCSGWTPHELFAALDAQSELMLQVALRLISNHTALGQGLRFLSKLSSTQLYRPLIPECDAAGFVGLLPRSICNNLFMCGRYRLSRRKQIFFPLLLAFSGIVPLASTQVGGGGAAPESKNDGWSTATLESAGISNKPLAEMERAAVCSNGR